MKKVYRRVVTSIVTLSLLASLACHANDIQKVTSFSDVSPSYWGYETIMDMAQYGILKGTTTPVNGVGTFSPEETMTRAEFITAALRAVCPTEANAIELDKDSWWRGYYILALDMELIKSFELDDGDLSQPMSREEMAMVMVRCVENMGEELDQRVAVSQIADYDNVDDYYKEYVRDCFSFGLLCGVDSNGTFIPTRTLTRAEAATVLCRLVNEDMRVEVEFEEESVETNDDNQWDSYKDETDDRNDRNDRDDNEDEEVVDNQEEVKKPDNDNQYDETDKVDNNTMYDEPEKMEDEKPDLLPWENGGKTPSKYTYEEFESLTGAQQMAFQKYLGDNFDAWLQQAQGGIVEDNTEDIDLPWENGGKTPSKYTYEEFESLTGAQQMAFQKAIDFDAWLESVQSGDIDDNEMPWEAPNAKRPEDYTWDDFLKLTPGQSIDFQGAFEETDGFEKWLVENSP